MLKPDYHENEHYYFENYTDLKRKYGEYFLILAKYVEVLHFIIHYKLKTEQSEIAMA